MLLEFARRTHQRLGETRVSPWIHAPVVLAVLGLAVAPRRLPAGDGGPPPHRHALRHLDRGPLRQGRETDRGAGRGDAGPPRPALERPLLRRLRPGGRAGGPPGALPPRRLADPPGLPGLDRPPHPAGAGPAGLRDGPLDLGPGHHLRPQAQRAAKAADPVLGDGGLPGRAAGGRLALHRLAGPAERPGDSRRRRVVRGAGLRPPLRRDVQRRRRRASRRRAAAAAAPGRASRRAGAARRRRGLAGAHRGRVDRLHPRRLRDRHRRLEPAHPRQLPRQGLLGAPLLPGGAGRAPGPVHRPEPGHRTPRLLRQPAGAARRRHAADGGRGQA